MLNRDWKAGLFLSEQTRCAAPTPSPCKSFVGSFSIEYSFCCIRGGRWRLVADYQTAILAYHPKLSFVLRALTEARGADGGDSSRNAFSLLRM